MPVLIVGSGDDFVGVDDSGALRKCAGICTDAAVGAASEHVLKPIHDFAIATFRR